MQVQQRTVVLRHCQVGRIRRPAFLRFLVAYPGAYRSVIEQMTTQYYAACGQLRAFALTATAAERLAKLLLDLCAERGESDTSAEVRLLLTHEEMAEYIGSSRETVTRMLGIFKSRRLIELRGSTLWIPDRAALASLADV